MRRSRELWPQLIQDCKIPYIGCGAVMVATTEEEKEIILNTYVPNAAANGVDDLRLIPAAEAKAMEPALQCTAALVSPSTGIIDSHAYMLALQGDA